VRSSAQEIGVTRLDGPSGLEVLERDTPLRGGDVRNALRSLAPFGRLMTVGFASGEIPTVKLYRLLLTNTDVRGVESDHLWSQGLSRAAWDVIMSLAATGHIDPVVHSGGGLADYAAALENLATRSVIGRVVLTV